MNYFLPLVQSQDQPNLFGNSRLYKSFKNTLPYNLKKTPESDYAMKRYWKSSGRPKTFEDSMSGEEQMFRMEQDGLYHAPSVDPKTLKFLKPKDHPTVQLELDWYNSDDPEAVDFRSKYDLNTDGKYYRYVPKRRK